MIENSIFLNAYFIDDNRTVIETLWQDKDDLSVRPFHITAEDDNPNYTKLLELITIDDLHEQTYKNIKSQTQAFQAMTIKTASELGMLYEVDGLNNNFWQEVGKTLLTHDFDAERDKEALFLYKLQLFEQPIIKESEDRDAKAELRKSKNFMEASHAALSIALAGKK